MKVFIDGRNGTTGFRICERLQGRKDISLIVLKEEDRKNAKKRKEAIFESDVTFLCLPDDAAREAAALSEGATKLLECTVSGAADEKTAKTVAKSVICSSLLKAAMFGADANWGRVLCAIGYSGADVDVNKIHVSFVSAAGEVAVCESGAGLDFSEELAKKILTEKEIGIYVNLNSGAYNAVARGRDFGRHDSQNGMLYRSHPPRRKESIHH